MSVRTRAVVVALVGAFAGCASSRSGDEPSARPAPVPVAVTHSASVAAPAASASTSTSASASAVPAPPIVPYAPLPAVTACAACTWKGTGCVEGRKGCALDPAMRWKLQLVAVRAATSSGMDGAGLGPVALQEESAGKAPPKPKGTWRTLEPAGTTLTVTTAELVGLEEMALHADARSPLAAATRIDVGAALFRDGLTFRNADGDEGRARITADEAATLLPRVARPSPLPWPHDLRQVTRPAAYAHAVAVAKKAIAIDEQLATYRREMALTHRPSGFELQLVGFFVGARLVRLSVLAPYTPPTALLTHYFDDGELILTRSTLIGVTDERGAMGTTFETVMFASGVPVWSPDMAFDPPTALPPKGKKRDDTAKWLRALREPTFHIDDTP